VLLLSRGTPESWHAISEADPIFLQSVVIQTNTSTNYETIQ